MKKLVTLLALCAAAVWAQAKDYTVVSPDGHLSVTVQTGKSLTYSVQRDGIALLSPSSIGLTLEDGTLWGPGTKFTKATKQSVDALYDAPVFKRSQVRDHYNQLTLKAKGCEVQFRAYDDGIA